MRFIMLPLAATCRRYSTGFRAIGNSQRILTPGAGLQSPRDSGAAGLTAHLDCAGYAGYAASNPRYAADSFRPIRPAKISTALPRRAALSASPNSMMPSTNEPIAPIPVHIA